MSAKVLQILKKMQQSGEHGLQRSNRDYKGPKG